MLQGLESRRLFSGTHYIAVAASPHPLGTSSCNGFVFVLLGGEFPQGRGVLTESLSPRHRRPNQCLLRSKNGCHLSSSYWEPDSVWRVTELCGEGSCSPPSLTAHSKAAG